MRLFTFSLASVKVLKVFWKIDDPAAHARSCAIFCIRYHRMEKFDGKKTCLHHSQNEVLWGI